MAALCGACSQPDTALPLVRIDCLQFEGSDAAPQLALYGEGWTRQLLKAQPDAQVVLGTPARCATAGPHRLSVRVSTGRPWAPPGAPPAARGVDVGGQQISEDAQISLRIELPVVAEPSLPPRRGRRLEASAAMAFGGPGDDPSARDGGLRADYARAWGEAWRRLARKQRLLEGGAPKWEQALSAWLAAARLAPLPTATGALAHGSDATAASMRTTWEEAALAIDLYAESQHRSGVSPLLQFVGCGAQSASDHPTRPLVLRAIGALARIGDRSAVVPLIDAANRQPGEHVVQTAYAIARLGGRAATGWLLVLASAHEDERVRDAATDALSDLPQKKGGL